MGADQDKQSNQQNPTEPRNQEAPPQQGDKSRQDDVQRDQRSKDQASNHSQRQ